MDLDSDVVSQPNTEDCGTRGRGGGRGDRFIKEREQRRSFRLNPVDNPPLGERSDVPPLAAVGDPSHLPDRFWVSLLKVGIDPCKIIIVL